MKRFLHHSRPAILVALLALSGLALAVGPASATHAGSHPSITATGGDGYLSVNGTGFTPKGTVLVEVRHYNQVSRKWQLESKSYVKALGMHYACHTYTWGTICGMDPGGEISTDLVSQDGSVRVVAYDVSSFTWSNRANVYVFPIP